MVNKKQRIYVAGHRGMVGSAIVRKLQARTDTSIVTRSRAELDLADQYAVRQFFASEKIDQVYLAAAKVGGIYANNIYPADFIYQNLMIQANVINEAYKGGVGKLLFLGSSCIYPKLANQPMSEDALLTGSLEPTNEPYAIAKIAGIKLCESYNRQFGVDYRSAMPTNLYGPGDNYDLENSHVIPALIQKFADAVKNDRESVEIWGSGEQRREFLHVDDMAEACVVLMNLPIDEFQQVVEPMLSHINVGSGVDNTIAELAFLLKKISGYSGKIVFDKSKPDGAPRKLLDVKKLSDLGWVSKIDLNNGLEGVYKSYLGMPR